MGAEDNFWGVIDLVTMTAWDFKADDKGMTYPEPMDAIPADFADDAAIYRQELAGRRSRLRRRSHGEGPHGRRVLR